MLIHLYQMLSSKYRLGWSHLDESEYVATVKVLTPKTIEEKGIDGYTEITSVIAPSALRSINLSRAIEDTMTYSHCQHEYDCCGCKTVRAYARKVSPRQYSVYLSTSYNV